jgi:hypothetical protein
MAGEPSHGPSTAILQPTVDLSVAGINIGFCVPGSPPAASSRRAVVKVRRAG